MTAWSHLDTAAPFGFQQGPVEELQDCCSHGSAFGFPGRLSEAAAAAAAYLGKSLLPQPSTLPTFTFTHKLTGTILVLNAIQVMVGENKSSSSTQNKQGKIQEICEKSLKEVVMWT